MMDSINSEPISFANQREVKRVRTRLLFLAGICLGICVAYVIIVLATCADKYQEEDPPPSRQISPAFISLFFYSFGVLAAYKYYEIGLRVFAWLGVIFLIITSLAIITLNVDFFPKFSRLKSGGIKNDDFFDVIIFYSMSTILCIVVFVLTTIIVNRSFKLAKLLDGNQQSTVQQM